MTQAHSILTRQVLVLQKERWPGVRSAHWKIERANSDKWVESLPLRHWLIRRGLRGFWEGGHSGQAGQDSVAACEFGPKTVAGML